MSNEKLAEALRRTCRKMKTFSRTGVLDGAVAVWVDEIESAIAAHAAEAAQAQAQSGEWTPDLPQAYAVFWKAYQLANDCGHPQTSCYENGAMAVVYWAKKAMLAAAPQQAAEPVAWMASDNTGRVIDAKAKTAGSRAAATASATAIYSIPLYTHPQPAQDARLPSDEDFRLHLGELTSAELRVAQAAFRFAMAKESGR